MNLEYTPTEALAKFLEILQDKNLELYDLVQEAISQGKDIQEHEPEAEKKKTKTFRKISPYSDQEALRVAIKAIQAVTIELSSFSNSALDELKNAALAEQADNKKPGAIIEKSKSKAKIQAPGGIKAALIDMTTETELQKNSEEPFQLKYTDLKHLEELKNIILRLEKLTDFGESNDNIS